jgi:ubiquinone/menaquinone biosynthesis C-methylase UbiE
MNGNGDRQRDAEAARVRRTYAAYQRNPHRRRAWAADNPGNRAIREELLAAVLEEAEPQLASGGEVLDVGCGTGFWLQALQRCGIDAARLTGAEIQRERAAAAAERVPGATIVQADARALPLGDARFSVLLLFTVLSSLDGPQHVRRALSETRRVMAPGGVLLCYEPRLPNPFNRAVRRIRSEDLDLAGIRPRRERRLTVLPQVARRLGRHADTLYPRLARIGPLQSHRLVVGFPGASALIGREVA